MSAPKPAPKRPNYLGAIVAVALASIVAVSWVSITMPDSDSAKLIITMILGFATTTTAALMGFLKISQMELQINSRMDQLLRSEKALSRTEGVDAERRGEGR